MKLIILLTLHAFAREIKPKRLVENIFFEIQL